MPVCALYGSRVNTAPLRVMLDSNAFDALALDDHVRVLVGSAVEAGALDLVVTHVQMDEVGKTPDPKRTALLRLTVSMTYTSGIVLDVSRLDMAVFSTPEEDVIFDAVTVGNPRHNEDALITKRRARPVGRRHRGLRRCVGECELSDWSNLVRSD